MITETQKVKRIRQIIKDAEEQLGEVCECKVNISLKLMKRVIKKPKQIEQLKKLICKRFLVSWEEVTGPSRYTELVNARWAFMYIAHTKLEMNKSHVGEICNRDHASAIHAINSVEQMYFHNHPIVKIIDEIKLLTA